MPKSLNVSPARFSLRGRLDMPEIPLYLYQTPLDQERTQRGDDQLKTVLRHMLLIREFETMLHQLRSTGEYEGVACIYRGPAHLSVGQEAAAVGAALALAPGDHILGSHRSHGEFLAKGLSAIDQLSDNRLGHIMTAHDNGILLRLVENHLGDLGQGIGENFLLLGLLSEILMRSCGFNRGMGGSMHAFFPPFGAYPNNAIVGASAGIATGCALRKRNAGDGGIAVAMTGDGSTGCGQINEAMNFAAMAQLQSLWQDKQDSGLPVLFFFTNNFYAMGGQTIGETMAWDRLSRIGAGVNAAALHAETVDGTRPLAVADAVLRQRERLVAGQGPALLDVECYRYSGHSTSDANAYRSREEIKEWQEHDPIVRYADELQHSGVINANYLEDARSAVTEQITALVRVAADPALVKPVDIQTTPDLIGQLMFSGEQQPLPETPASAADSARCTRIRQNAKKARFGLDDASKPLSPMRAITLRDGLFEAILAAMLDDDRLIAYGEECREWGGAFGVYRGLADLFPHHRLFNAPISEATIVSSAVGYAMEGGRALVELMYGDFIGRAGDEILNQLSKWQAMSGGVLPLPVVLRCSIGSKYGAQHSQDWSSLVTHVPGLRVMYPATPYDAKGLMANALASNDPTVFFESQRLYDTVEQFHSDGVPEENYAIDAGAPDIKREGSDFTVLTIGPCLYPALSAATELASEHQLSAEVIDARTLVPFDYELVLASVRKTGRLLIVSEASERGSFAMTLAATVTRHAFSELQKPVRVLGSPNWIVPGAEMESTYFPQTVDILDVVTQEFFPETGAARQGVRRQDDLEMAREGL
ncbi:MAG: dehydrogenase [Gammaproteobacteria bacterium]|nr:dehydrogenase [Gammaproteobacteria bacterium]